MKEETRKAYSEAKKELIRIYEIDPADKKVQHAERPVGDHRIEEMHKRKISRLINRLEHDESVPDEDDNEDADLLQGEKYGIYR